MSRYDWLLFLHVASAFALVAALVLYTVLIAVVWNKDVPSDVARLFRISQVGDVLIAVGSIGVLVFGIWLAIDVDGYEVWDGWVIAALVLWFVMGAFGLADGKDLQRRARSGEKPRAGGEQRAERRAPHARPGPPRPLVPHGRRHRRLSSSST